MSHSGEAATSGGLSSSGQEGLNLRDAEYKYYPEDYQWVHSEVLRFETKLRSVKNLKKFVKKPEDWDLELVEEVPVCHRIPEIEKAFYFYKTFFDQYNVHIPLSQFQQDVLSELKVCPSQLSPTAWGFVKGFEAVVSYMGRPLSARVFMAQFQVVKPYHDEPGKARFVFLKNRGTEHSYFEAARDSNKGFKEEFLVVRARVKARGRVQLSCPTSWSREHEEYGYSNFHFSVSKLKAEEKETFRLLEAWGERLKAGLVKFHCGEIIEAERISAGKLKALLDKWHAYDAAKDPTVAERRAKTAEKARKKAEQRLKRARGESSATPLSASPEEVEDVPEKRARKVKDPSKPTRAEMNAMADFGLYLPSADELAALRKVDLFAEKLVEVYAEQFDGASLMEILKENEKFRSQVSLLPSAKDSLAAAQRELEAESFAEATRVAALREEARLAESAAWKEAQSLREQGAELESALAGAAEKMEAARKAGFSQARELTLISALDVPSTTFLSEMLCPENAVENDLIVRRLPGGETEVVYDPSG